MRRIWVRFWAWVARLWRREPRPLRTVLVEELPDRVEAGVVYVAGEGKFRWFVAMLCPCGCGETLHMNLQPETSPCWSLEEHPDGTATLSPSVWRKVGCRSHFFLQRGKIVWCD
jgi:hypothetical protein